LTLSFFHYNLYIRESDLIHLPHPERHTMAATRKFGKNTAKEDRELRRYGAQCSIIRTAGEHAGEIHHHVVEDLKARNLSPLLRNEQMILYLAILEALLLSPSEEVANRKVRDILAKSGDHKVSDDIPLCNLVYCPQSSLNSFFKPLKSGPKKKK